MFSVDTEAPQDLANIVYNIEQAPSWPNVLGLGVQYLVIFLPLIIAPLLTIGAHAVPQYPIYNIVFIAMIGTAVATLLIASKRLLGAGVFLPVTYATPLFAVSLIVSHTSNFATILGIGILAGAFQMLLCPLIRWIKPVFNRELAGFITMLLGLWVAQMGVIALFLPEQLTPFLFHPSEMPLAHINADHLLAGLLALMVMLLCRLRGTIKSRMFCILCGSIVGWAVAWLCGMLNANRLTLLEHAPWWHVFHINEWVTPQINWHFTLPCIIAAVIMTLQVLSMIAMIQDDCDGIKHGPELRKLVSRGNFSAGLSLMVSSCLGAPQAPNPGAFGVLSSTGVYTRKLAYVYAGFLVLLAFSPKLSFLFITIPASVRGATILFMGSAMFMHGLHVMKVERMTRFHAVVFALSLLVGASMSIIPSFYHTHLLWLAGITNPVFFIAICLYLVLHLSIKKKPETR